MNPTSEFTNITNMENNEYSGEENKQKRECERRQSLVKAEDYKIGNKTHTRKGSKIDQMLKLLEKVNRDIQKIKEGQQKCAKEY